MPPKSCQYSVKMGTFTEVIECFRNHTKGGFIGGFLFRINVKKVKPFAQPVLGLSPYAISCNVIEYADERIAIL